MPPAPCRAERTDPGAGVDLSRPAALPADPPRAPNHSGGGDAPHRAPAEPPATEDRTVDQAVDPSPLAVDRSRLVTFRHTPGTQNWGQRFNRQYQMPFADSPADSFFHLLVLCFSQETRILPPGRNIFPSVFFWCYFLGRLSEISDRQQTYLWNQVSTKDACEH